MTSSSAPPAFDPPSSEPARAVDADEPLLDRFLAGDRGAFDELMLRHSASVRKVVMRYVRHDEDAEDITQRTFMKALQHLGSFRREAAFRTWLHRIAVHLALNHLRGQKRSDEEVDFDDVPAFTSALGTSRLVAAEVWTKVAERLVELPPKQRLTVELRLFHELSFQEIAAVAGCSEDSAKANFRHGVKRLRGLVPDPHR